jgi:hypothetical protein
MSTVDKVLLKNLEGEALVKSAIVKMIKNEGTLRKVARNMVKRVYKCVEMNGHHFQHLL